MKDKSKREWLVAEIRSQQRWIREHGETLAGYVDHYGSKHDAEHYGDGGEAIYKADLEALLRLQEWSKSLGPEEELRAGAFYHVILNKEQIADLRAHMTYGDAIRAEVQEQISHEIACAIRRGIWNDGQP